MEGIGMLPKIQPFTVMVSGFLPGLIEIHYSGSANQNNAESDTKLATSFLVKL